MILKKMSMSVSDLVQKGERNKNLDPMNLNVLLMEHMSRYSPFYTSVPLYWESPPTECLQRKSLY